MNEYEKILAIVSDLGYYISKDAAILDLGCGLGVGVEFLQSQQFSNVLGCDFKEALPASSSPDNSFVVIESPSQLPFDDHSFDFIYSSQVFEHIQDLSLTLSEMSRILKPNGISLNIFPPKWRWIEPHVNVPLAGAIQKKWWLTFWAYLGIKNEFQSHLNPSGVAKINYKYLTQNTKYLSTKQIYNLSTQFFQEVKFCEKYKAKYSQKKFLYKVLEKIPFLDSYLCDFNMKVLFLKK